MHTPRYARQALFALLAVAALAAPAPAAPGRAHARPSGPRPVLGFIDDAYQEALTLARARKLPLFIESWAPW